MTDPAAQPERANRFDDPTRDIRLPRPAGSPPPVLRPEWSTFATQTEAVAPPAAGVEPAPGSAAGTAAPVSGIAGPPTRAERLAGEPTDELVPPASLVREPTLKFDQGSGAPVGPPAVAPATPPARRARKWPFLVLVLIPVLVIVGSGIWLLVLISHG
jgi:hypothetical protein